MTLGLLPELKMILGRLGEEVMILNALGEDEGSAVLNERS